MFRMASGGEGGNLEKKFLLLRRRLPLSPGLASGHVSLEGGGGDCCEKSRGGVFMHEMGHFWASRLREKNVIGERGRKREHFHRLPLNKQRPEQLHSCPNKYLDSGKTFLIIPLSLSRNFSRRRREGSSVSDFYDQGQCLPARLSSFKKLHLSAKRHFPPDSGSFTTVYLYARDGIREMHAKDLLPSSVVINGDRIGSRLLLLGKAMTAREEFSVATHTTVSHLFPNPERPQKEEA